MFTIRRARPEDAEGIIAAHTQSVRDICSQDYDPHEIEAWAGRKMKAVYWRQIIDRDFVWVVEKDGDVLGFGHFAIMDEETGEVLGLYLVPSALRKGLGKEMVLLFVDIAKKHGLRRITLFATKTAKTFYESIGFYQNAGDTSIDMQGVPIACHPMEKIIDASKKALPPMPILLKESNCGEVLK